MIGLIELVRGFWSILSRVCVRMIEREFVRMRDLMKKVTELLNVLVLLEIAVIDLVVVEVVPLLPSCWI